MSVYITIIITVKYSQQLFCCQQLFLFPNHMYTCGEGSALCECIHFSFNSLYTQ